MNEDDLNRPGKSKPAKENEAEVVPALREYLVLTPQDKIELVKRRLADLEVQHYNLMINLIELQAEGREENAASIEGIKQQMAIAEQHIEAVGALLPSKNEEKEKS